MFGFFGKKKKEPPKPKTLDQMSSEELKAFQKSVKKELRTSMRALDRNIFDSERTLKEAQRDLEKKIKEGADRNVLRMYAKNVVSARQGRDKHKVNRTKVQSVEFSINQMVMNVKMAKVTGQAGKIMGQVNGMMNIQEINKNMMNLQNQFEKAGIVAEMMDDALDMDDELSDVDEAVDNLLDSVEQKVNPNTNKKKTVTNNNNQEDNLEDQIKNLTL